MEQKQELKQIVQGKFWRNVVLNFYHKSGLDAAMVLAYTTLFALVPLLSLLFIVLSSSGFFIEQKNLVGRFIFSVIVPSATPIIKKYLISFSDQAVGLSGISIIFIVVTSVVLLITMDNKINTMWSSRLQRGFLKSLTHFFGIAVLGPIFILFSLALGAILVTLDLLYNSGLEAYSGFIVSLMTLLGFSLLYKFIPIKRPTWISAILGSILVSGLIEVLKFGFAIYVSWFPTYNLVYGAFSAIPIFLLWLFCLWSTIIFSASFIYQLDLAIKNERK